MRNSNKLLALALAAALVLGTTTTAFAAADSSKDSDGEATPISDTNTDKAPADSAGDEEKADGEDASAEDEDKDNDAAAPVEGEDKDNDAAAPVEGEDKDDDAAAPAEGEDKGDDAAAPVEGEDKDDDAAAPALNYTDVTESNWYYGAVSFVTEQKLMDGLTDTTFGPSEDMTRQMLAVALYRLAGSPEVTAENPFTDVAADAAYKDAVVWAFSVGVVTGVTDTTFSPDSSVQRQAIAAMLARYLKVDTSANADVSAFADADAIQNYAMSAMAWAAANELLQGNPDGTVNPRGNATRSQVATILQRFAAMAEGKAPVADTAAPAGDDTAAPSDDTTTPTDTDTDNAEDSTTAPSGDDEAQADTADAPASASDAPTAASTDDTDKE